MNSISQHIALARTIIATAMAGTLAFGAMAADAPSMATPIGAHESATVASACDDCAGVSDASAGTAVRPTMAALGAMQSFRSAAPRRADSARARWLARPGMRVVLRVPLVDLIAHPDSGDMLLTTRTRVLKGSIASARVAVAVAWTY